MVKYYLICGKRLVKGVTSGDTYILASSAYEYINGQWVGMDVNEINDRLVGYDPSEDEPYSFGNMSMMEEIKEISEEEMRQYL